ncbi:FkbM family methyltransferase [Phreatobacter oligotrophus]|uniref:FkbM family methyltransferase n=1 Tax=Phreatobacter oligotrophus TaxID=1122261 RepID=UPI000D3CCA54|nr:FkbM family methyltransferase [Phreatobacter oligotrophus]
MHVATPVMVELGAYWGHYSMWMMKKKPLSRVVLIDESAENLGSAQYNFGLNGYRGKLSVGRIGFCDDTLGNICTTHNLPIIDILHVDIQGAEVDLLQDSIKILSSGSVRIIFLSTHSNYIHGLCYRLLQFCGFRIEVSSDFDHHSTSYDGFILAAYHDLDPIFPGFLPWGRADICEANPDQIVDYIRQVGTLRAGWSSGLR